MNQDAAGQGELRGRVLKLTVLVGEGDRAGHRPLTTELVHRAHTAGLAGASVFRGVEGFGRSSRIHTARLLSLTEELPMAVVIVDVAERVEAFLPEVVQLVGDRLAFVEEVRPVGPASGPPAGPGQP